MVTPAVMTYCGVETSLFVRLTSLGVHKIRATARRVSDAHLWEHCLASAKNILNYCHFLGDKLVHWTSGALDDIGDEPVPQ